MNLKRRMRISRERNPQGGLVRGAKPQPKPEGVGLGRDRQADHAGQYRANQEVITSGDNEEQPRRAGSQAQFDVEAHREHIHRIAYAIWEEEGKPEGKHLEHWKRAERTVQAQWDLEHRPKAIAEQATLRGSGRDSLPDLGW